MPAPMATIPNGKLSCRSTGNAGIVSGSGAVVPLASSSAAFQKSRPQCGQYREGPRVPPQRWQTPTAFFPSFATPRPYAERPGAGMARSSASPWPRAVPMPTGTTVSCFDERPQVVDAHAIVAADPTSVETPAADQAPDVLGVIAEHGCDGARRHVELGELHLGVVGDPREGHGGGLGPIGHERDRIGLAVAHRGAKRCREAAPEEAGLHRPIPSQPLPNASSKSGPIPAMSRPRNPARRR